MRDRELDFLLVLAALAEGESLNKYQIEKRVKILKRRAEGRFRQRFPQSVSHRAMREAIDHLRDSGEIRTEGPVGPGRAPGTKTVFYHLTDLGRERLKRTNAAPDDFYIDVEKARRIVEARYTSDARRAFQEMSIADDWFTWRLDNLIGKALREAKYSDLEKVARTVSSTMIPDLTRLMRARYRHREVNVEGIPIFDLRDALPFDEDRQESCRAWIEKFAPAEFRQYAGKLPDYTIAWTYLFSRNARQAVRQLERLLRDSAVREPEEQASEEPEST